MAASEGGDKNEDHRQGRAEDMKQGRAGVDLVLGSTDPEGKISFYSWNNEGYMRYQMKRSSTVPGLWLANGGSREGQRLPAPGWPGRGLGWTIPRRANSSCIWVASSATLAVCKLGVGPTARTPCPGPQCWQGVEAASLLCSPLLVPV